MAICSRCGAQLVPEGRFCAACGAAVQVSAPHEERKVVTVLFADVIGSTALSERLDPEWLRVVLDTYFSAMSEVVKAWGGEVEKFIGDAIVARFGVPANREDDADRALQAALEMLHRLVSLNRDFEARYRLTLNMRIGVNTGEVITSVSDRFGQGLMSGEAVNVAARLQEVAEPGTILVGDRTYRVTRNAFSFSEPIALHLKGKSGPVTARRLLKPVGEAVRGVPGLQSPMVGREPELRALASLMEEVLEVGRPRLVTVLGPAGVGKSRLVREFVYFVRDRHPESRILRGRCLAAGQGITYWALGEMLRDACAILLDDPAEVAWEKLRSGLHQILAPLKLTDSETNVTIHALAATAGIALPDNPLGQLAPQAVASEMARAWPRFASALTASGVCCFVVEDLHWAGDPLLDMLERVIARTSGTLLIIGTARPDLAEMHPSFGGGSEDFSRVSLRPLTERHSTELIAGLLSAAELPAALQSDILLRAGGNPFFLEEILRRLIDEGVLVPEDGRWRATTTDLKTPLPDSLHSLLAARIDSLSTESKRVLQEAAVVGQVFWEQPVGLALGRDSISDELVELERRGLIMGRPNSSLAGQAEFMFKHILVRDVAYGSLPRTRRARAHADVGSWIEGLAGERVEEFAELLAHHYVTAVKGDDADLAWGTDPARDPVRRKAVEYLLLAGVVARRRFAVKKAIELHESALELTSDGEQLPALEELGADHESSYHGEKAMAAYQRALDIGRVEPSGATDRARLCFKLAWLMTNTPGAFQKKPDPATVDALVAEGLAAAEPRESRQRAQLLMARGLCGRLWGGSGLDPMPVADRIASAEEAIRIAESLEANDLVRSATDVLRILFGVDGRFTEALELSRRMLGQVDQLKSKADQAETLLDAGLRMMEVAGDYEGGLELGRQAHALSRHTNPHQLMHATHTVLVALYYLGRWTELMPIFQEHLAAFERQPDAVCGHVRSGPIIGAMVLAHMGEFERARQIVALVGDPRDRLITATAWEAQFAALIGDLRTGRQITEPRGTPRSLYGPQHALVLIEVLVASRDWDALQKFLPDARRQADGEALLVPSCDRAEGQWRAHTGDGVGAIDALRKAVEGFERLKVPFEEARSRQALAEVLTGAEARSNLESALAIFTRLGALPYVQGVRAKLSETS